MIWIVDNLVLFRPSHCLYFIIINPIILLFEKKKVSSKRLKAFQVLNWNLVGSWVSEGSSFHLLMHMTQVQSLGGASDWEKGLLDQANTLFNNVKRISSFGRTLGAKSLKQCSERFKDGAY